MPRRRSVPEYIPNHEQIQRYTYNVNHGARVRCAGLTNFVGTIPPYDLYLKMEHQNWMCIYCGEPLTLNTCQLDHVHPLSKGGDHYLYNVAFSCSICNQNKQAKSLSAFCKQRGFDIDEIRQRMADINQKLHDYIFRDYSNLDS